VADEPWSYPQIIHVLREGTLHLEHIKPANTFGYRFIMGEESDLGQRHENVKLFLKEHVDMRTAIEERLRRDLGLVQEQEPQPV